MIQQEFFNNGSEASSVANGLGKPAAAIAALLGIRNV